MFSLLLAASPRRDPLPASQMKTRAKLAWAGTCTITEHILNQARVWALGGQDKASALGRVRIQHSATGSGLRGQPWARHLTRVFSWPLASFCSSSEKFKSFAQVSDSENLRGRPSLKSSLRSLLCNAPSLPPPVRAAPAMGVGGECPQCCGEASRIRWASPTDGGWRPELLKGKGEE